MKISNANAKNQNAKSPIAKSQKSSNANLPKKEDKKEEKLSEINLSKFAEKLEGMEIKGEKKDRLHLYIYPSHFNKEIINGLEGKKFRNKMRNHLQSICNNIFFFAKGKNIDGLKKEIEKFDLHYSNYRINDLSLSSLSNSNDEKKNANISFALDIIKEIKSSK